MTWKFKATLTPGEAVPAPVGVGSTVQGTLSVTLTGSNLSWALSFQGLSGTARAAGIAAADRGKTGPLVIGLCTNCAAASTGSMTISTGQFLALASGKAYVNITTDANPAGELRGQLIRTS